MSATTADCKEFLSTELNLNTKGFKRIRKFKDGSAIIREFSHPSYTDPIYISEENGQLTLTTASTPSSQKSLANKYVFSLIDENNEEFDENVFIMTRRSYWEKEACINDQSDYKPLDFLPPEWNADDVNECGTWVIQTNMTGDEIIATLHDLGCHSDAEFDQLCEGRSALNCPLILDRKIKQVLNQTLSDSNITPTVQPPSKI